MSTYPSHNRSPLPILNGSVVSLHLLTRHVSHIEFPYGCPKLISEQPLDIALLGFPYDTSTSYRPGARFGPRGIRAGSAREKKGRSYNTVWGVDPYDEGLEIVIHVFPSRHVHN